MAEAPGKPTESRRLLGISEAGWHGFEVDRWQGGDGVPTICVHGLTRSARDFDWLAPALAAKGDVWCPDIVGRGRSDWLRDSDQYQITQYVRDMAALVSVIGDGPVDWVGTSMGGLMGMVLAATPGTPIRRLVLNDVGPFVSAAAMTDIQNVFEPESFDDQAAFRRWLDDAMADWGPLPPHVLDHLAATGSRPLPGGRVARAFDPGIGEALAKTGTQAVDLWLLWEAISCPVLVLRGERSTLLEELTADRMAEREHVRLVTIPHCGHAPSLMVPEQIALVAEWLAG
ncbi:MAG: alpha/beta hydrolase [Azospirillaceae bacterium]